MSRRLRPTSVSSDILIHICNHLTTIDVGWKLAATSLLGEGRLGPHLPQRWLGWVLPPHQVASWCIKPFGHNKNGPKIGGSAPFLGSGSWVPSNTMSAEPRPTSVPNVLFLSCNFTYNFVSLTNFRILLITPSSKSFMKIIEIRSVERGICPIAELIVTDSVIFQWACVKLPYFYFRSEIGRLERSR